MRPLLLLLFAAASLAGAAEPGILPGVAGTWKQVSVAPLETKTNRALWDEFGLQDSQSGTYALKGKKMDVDAWRLSDSTNAMAAFDLLRPADARSAPQFDTLTPDSALIPNGALVAAGNYLLRFRGAVPDIDAVANMLRSMPRYDTAPLPTFITYLPRNAAPNSVHYIGGPAALAQYFPGVSPAQVAFHLGAEGITANYKSGLSLALFSYPLPAMARGRAAELSKIPGSVVKRSGPLVAVVLHPDDANAAESLLSQVRYQASVTTGEKPPSKKDNPGNLLLNVIFLIAILAAFCVASGLLFAFFRIALRRTVARNEDEEILALHLEGR